MSSKSELIIVPGAWHSPEAFQPTTALLKKAGYTVHGVTLPSVGASPQVQSFDPDVQAVRSVIDKVLSAGKDAVVIMHSYGGVVGSEALAEYLQTLQSGQKQGYGKVKRLVFVCAFALPEGASLMAALQFKPLPWFILDVRLSVSLFPRSTHKTNVIVINEQEKDIVKPDKPQEIFYNDIEPSVAEPYISALRTQSYPTFSSQLTVAPYKIIPSTYILCEKDNAIPVSAQEGMVAGAKAAAPSAFDVVERVDASHSPFISQPEWLAEKFIKAAQ